MATLIVHAGMSKTGSSSIQRWLGDRAAWLRRERGVHVLAVRAATHPSDPQVVGCTSGSVATSLDSRPLTSAAATQLFQQLDQSLQDKCTAVVTSEAFGPWFYGRRGRVLLPLLEELALAHAVQVAYYVRPQHTALEAAWRQWGFREPLPPSDYVRQRLDMLHFLRTLDRVAREAPHVSFEMRPFRVDLLEGGDVVIDFAKVFLGLNEAPSSPASRWENRGLPLELANVLRHAPAGMFWTSQHDNRTLRKLRDLGVTEWPLVEGARARESRALLQAFCHREFEPENQELIGRLGWCTDHFVPPSPAGTNDRVIDLARLDHLWEPEASEQERALLFCALQQLLQTSSRTLRPSNGPMQTPSSANQTRIERVQMMRQLRDLSVRIRRSPAWGYLRVRT